MELEQKSNAVKISAIAVVGLIAVVALLQHAIINAQNQDTISVVGQAKVHPKNDMAIINLGIATFKTATPEEALNQTTQKVAAVEATLDGMNVAKEDRQVTAYTFDTQFNSNSSSTDSGSQDNQKPEIIGYNGFQNIAVKIKGIDADPTLIDKIIAATAKNGVNQVGSVKFLASDIESVKQEARIMAIADAKNKATAMAKSAGLSLGNVSNLIENVKLAPGQGFDENNGSSYDSSSVSFSNSSSPLSTSSNVNITDLVMEVTLDYRVK